MSKHRPTIIDSPSYLVWRANNLWQRQIKALLQSHEIGYVEFMLLTVLAFDMNWRCGQDQLARALQLNKMVVSQGCRKLEGKGLVRLTQGIIDGRAISLQLTSKGFKVAAAATKKLGLVDEKFAKEMPKIPEK